MSQTLHTPRLLLRTPCAADIPHVQTAMENHEVNKWIKHAPWPYAPGSAEWFVNHQLGKIAEGKTCMWTITSTTTAEFLGLIDYAIKENGQASRGFWLKQEAWNKGYMQEATSATLQYIFTNTHITVVAASNVQSNDASRNVKLKTGFKLFEVKEVEVQHGKVDDHVMEVYHLTKADWLARQGDGLKQ